jgi:hypothetical protein
MYMFTLSEKPGKLALLPTVLDLFDERAAAGGTGAGASASGATEGTATNASGTSQTGDGGEPVVVYGKDPNATADQTTPDSEQSSESPYADLSPEEKQKAYHELIKGDFKDVFTEHTQQIINDRFKKAKKIERRLDEVQPILDLLMPRYGAKSVAELSAKLEDEIIPDLAYEAGMSPEAYQKQLTLERENARLKAEHEQRTLNERVDGWFREAETLKAKYPDFDLVQKADHPKYGQQFLRLLESGIDVEAAYLAAFHDEIIGRAKAETAKKAESATLEAIKSGGMRPAEVGAKNQSGIVRKSSVSELSAEDRAEIARRAARGEKIRF